MNLRSTITLKMNAHCLKMSTCAKISTIKMRCGLIAAMPAPGAEWSIANAGKGGLILWPMFGATNQLLGGLAFLVIAFYLWRRGRAIWFIAIPLVFMLIMPAWAMIWLIFIADGPNPGWAFADSKNWVLVAIAVATLLLEAWMLVEAALLFPKVRGLVEPAEG